MKAYKIFRIIDGELYSASSRGKAQIHYRPGEKRIGRVFGIIGMRKKIRNPIFAYRTIEDARANFGVQEIFELWEVKGSPWRKKLIGMDAWFFPPKEGFVFNLIPVKKAKQDLPKGTILLSSCIPVRNIEITEQKGGVNA